MRNTNFTQIIADIEYCGDKLPPIEKIMEKAILNIGELHIVNKLKHNFNPYGLSIVWILEESHISIHTWEEYNLINVDMFSCGCTPLNTYNSFLDGLTVKNKKEQIITRTALLNNKKIKKGE